MDYAHIQVGETTKECLITEQQNKWAKSTVILTILE